VRRCLRPAAPADDSAAQITWRAGDVRLIVPGECHGAPETPRVVADLVERYSRDSDMVSLAMEMPMSGNVARARYLRSNGDSTRMKHCGPPRSGSPRTTSTTGSSLDMLGAADTGARCRRRRL
jgi:hypothetical protein